MRDSVADPAEVASVPASGSSGPLPLLAQCRTRLDRHAYALAIGLVLLHGALAWLARPAGVETAADDATYVLLSESLSDGHYRDQWLTEQPIHQKYPPGYPAILAVWGLLGLNHFEAQAFLEIAFSAGAIWLTFLIAAQAHSRALAVVVTFALASNPFLVQAAGELRSEAPFMFFSMLLIWLSMRSATTGTRVAMMACALALAFIRTIGVSAIAGLGLYWLLQKRYRDVAVLGTLAVLTVGAWLAWTAIAPDKVIGVSYLADAAGVFNRRIPFVTSIVIRIGEIGQSLAHRLPWPTVPGTPIDNAVAGLISAVGLVTGFVWSVTRVPLLASYVTFYVAIVVIWSFFAGRFLEPFLPLFMLLLLIGLLDVLRRTRVPAPGVLTTGLAAMFVFTGWFRTGPLLAHYAGCRDGRDTPANACVEPEQAGFFNAVRYARDNLPTDAIVFNGKPATWFLYTRMQSPSPALANRVIPSAFAAYLREQGTTHVLLGALEAREWSGLARRMQAACRDLDLIGSWPPHTYLFTLRGAAADQAGPAHACAAITDYRTRITADPDERSRRPFGRR